MEDELRANLLACARAFSAARKIELGTVGRQVVNDWGFFERVADTSKSFTARTYDRVIDWFDVNWPDDSAWPIDVPRPSILPSSIPRPSSVSVPA